MTINVKKDGSWTQIPVNSITTGLSDAPKDGNAYVRKNGTWSELDTNVSETDLTAVNSKIAANTAAIEALPTEEEVDEKINTAIASVYRVMGSVDNYSSLPTTGVKVGDVYNLLDTGSNYVAISVSGTTVAWDKLSETVDLTGYLTKTEADAKYWHSGNDGSGSGLDADMLDGVGARTTTAGYDHIRIINCHLHSGNNLLKYYRLGYLPTAANVSNGISFAQISFYGGANFGANTQHTYQIVFGTRNVPSLYCIRDGVNTDELVCGYVVTDDNVELWVNPTSGYHACWSWEIKNASQFIPDGKTEVNEVPEGLVEATYYDVAHTNQNVASATKLATARSIWGQSFDGTGDVDGILTINYEKATANDGALNINKTNSASFYDRPISILYPNLANGGIPNIYVGKNNSKYNGGYLSYTHNSDSSDTNYMSIGLYSADKLLNVLGNGNVGIGTTSPSTTLDVNGTIKGDGSSLTSLNASNISSGTISSDRLPAATTSEQGAMTAAMVTKLNGITESADSVSISRSLTSGTKIGTITINGTGTDLYCQTNTTYSAGTGLSLSGTSFGLSTSGVTAGSYGPTAAVTGNNGTTINIPQITVDEYGRVTSVVNRVFTAVNTDTNTTYSAATTSANGLMSSTDKTKMDRIRSYTTATTVVSLNVNYEIIYVTLTANSSLSASATGTTYNGYSITAYVYTDASYTITIPTTGNYVSMCGSSFTTVAGGWVEFNLTCINGIWHIAKLEQE